MRKFTMLFALIISLTLSASDSDEKSEKHGKSEGKSEMSSGPSTYVAAIVTRGENWQMDSLRATELQEKHLEFLNYLKDADKLIASGPLTTSPDARGLYIFKVSTIEQAKALTMRDEAVSSGWIAMDFHVWKSRDYDVPEPVEAAESEESGSEYTGNVIMVAIFTLIIMILAIRTFRMKSSV